MQGEASLQEYETPRVRSHGGKAESESSVVTHMSYQAQRETKFEMRRESQFTYDSQTEQKYNVRRESNDGGIQFHYSTQMNSNPPQHYDQIQNFEIEEDDFRVDSDNMKDEYNLIQFKKSMPIMKEPSNTVKSIGIYPENVVHKKITGKTFNKKVRELSSSLEWLTEEMDSFLEAFCALDVDNREVISIDDLHSYNEKHDLEDSFPETFMSVFDSDKTGTITLEQYCRTLGLIPKQARDFRRRRTTHLLEEVTPADLEMVHDDMDINIKLRIYQMLLEDLRLSGQQPNIDVQRLDAAVKNVKKYLESVHGRAWQIIVSINQQLAWFNYLPGYMLHFCLGRFAVLIWKTPAQ